MKNELPTDNMKLNIFAVLLVIIHLREATSVIYSKPLQNFANSKGLVPKVSLTQKGYIQFLKYIVDVPEITDYTFCIWVKSNNFTYNQPLFSYSKNENQRLIRAWITPTGSHINLEILERPISSTPTHLLVNEWYHICQSWSSNHAAWALYLNGILKANGFAPELRKVAIEPGGDIVVGQEYTDFDKGLDDGIEGDISGFNLVLASTFSIPYTHYALTNRYVPNNVFKREISENDEKEISNEQQFTKADKTHVKRQISDVFAIQQDHRQQRRKTSYDKPLGLVMVELSNDCGYLRGAPLSGKRVLVSWTKTNVRVFGGAILKTVPPFCIRNK